MQHINQSQPVNSGADPRNFLPEISPANAQQHEWLNTIRALIADHKPSASTQDFLDALMDRLPAHKLFSPWVLRATVFYKGLLECLQKLGVEVKPHPPNKRRLYARRIAYSIYTTAEDQVSLEIAEKLLVTYQNWDPTNPASPPLLADMPVVPPTGSPHASFPFHSPQTNFPSTSSGPMRDNTAHNFRSNFRNVDAKYTGDIKQDWDDMCTEYDLLASTYELNENQKAKFISNMLYGDALDFYNDHVKPHALSFEEATKMIRDRFNGPAEQSRVKIYLQSLRFNQFLRDHVGPLDALDHLSSTIRRNFKKTPKGWQTAYGKIELLEKAVADQPWADTPINRLYHDLTNYEDFLSALGHSLQRHLEKGNRVGQSSTENSIHLSDEYHAHDAFFQQGRYGRDTRRPSNFKPRTPRSSVNIPARSGRSSDPCFNCGKVGDHFWQDGRCSIPLDFTRVAANKAAWLNKRRAQRGGRVPHPAYGERRVLLEFAEQLNSLSSTDHEDQAEALFESAMSIQDTDVHEDSFGDDREVEEQNDDAATEQLNVHHVSFSPHEPTQMDTFYADAEKHSSTAAAPDDMSERVDNHFWPDDFRSGI